MRALSAISAIVVLATVAYAADEQASVNLADAQYHANAYGAASQSGYGAPQGHYGAPQGHYGAQDQYYHQAPVQHWGADYAASEDDNPHNKWTATNVDETQDSGVIGMKFYLQCCRECSSGETGAEGSWGVSASGSANYNANGGAGGQSWGSNGGASWNVAAGTSKWTKSTNDLGLPDGFVSVGGLISCKFRCAAHALLMRWKVLWFKVSKVRTSLVLLYKDMLEARSVGLDQTQATCVTYPLPTGIDGMMTKLSIPYTNEAGANVCLAKNGDETVCASSNCYVIYNSLTEPPQVTAPAGNVQSLFVDVFFDFGNRCGAINGEACGVKNVDALALQFANAGSLSSDVEGVAVTENEGVFGYNPGYNFFAFCRRVQLQLTCLKAVHECYETTYKWTCQVEKFFGTGIYLLVAAYLCIFDVNVWSLYAGMDGLGGNMLKQNWPNHVETAKKLMLAIQHQSVSSPLHTGSLVFAGFAAGVVVFVVAKFASSRLNGKKEEVTEGYTSLL